MQFIQSTKGIISFIEDPLNAILNGLVRIVLMMFIPVPLPDAVIIQLRTSILQILFTLLLVIIVTIIGFIGIISLPFAQSPTLIVPVTDTSFVPTDIPFQNPFGGSGLSFVRITAYFRDPAYYTYFGKWHTGVDFVPSDIYYQQSSAYIDSTNINHDIIIFSTINGTVSYYQDQYGSHTVEVLNKGRTLKVLYLHLNNVFVTTGQEIVAGTPIGTMGNTGFSTGEHLHYEIQVKNNGTWTAIDPLEYIQQ